MQHEHSTSSPGFLPAQIGNAPITMSSREIAELVETRHDSVKRTMERLSESGLIRFTPLVETSHEGAGSRPVEVYQVDERDSYVVVARLSPEFTARLVDFWQSHRNITPRIPTTAEAFASAFTMLAAHEARQAEQSRALKALDAKVTEVAQAHVVLDKMPSDCESIVYVRRRMNKTYGLSEAVVDKVMRDTPYSPTIRALVKNQHVDADGAHYAGFAKKEVSAIFKRFTDECQMVSAIMATHPFVDGRFKLAGKAGA